MPRNLLSTSILKAKLPTALVQARDSGSPVRLGDGDGLMLVVRPSGEASWVLRYSFKAKRNDITLGRWPSVDLKEARAGADRARGSISKGLDPADQRKAAREERRAQSESAQLQRTVRGLFEDWMSKANHSSVYQGNIEAAFKANVLPFIGAMQPHEVDRRKALSILRTIEDRGSLVMVRRVRMWLRQMFDYGIEHEAWPLLQTSPVPLGTLKSFKDPVRGRHFPAITRADDVPALMQKLLGVTDNFVVRNALLLSAHVWQRPSEIRLADWSEFDLDGARWTIPAERMKLRVEHLVPLSRQVVALLRTYQGVVGTQGFLFPGRRYNMPISEGTLTGRLNTMGYLSKHSPHGFRAMARTIGEEVLGIEPKLLEKQLSHEVDASGLRGAYNRAEYWSDRVTMMQAWSDWLDLQSVQP